MLLHHSSFIGHKIKQNLRTQQLVLIIVIMIKKNERLRATWCESHHKYTENIQLTRYSPPPCEFPLKRTLHSNSQKCKCNLNIFGRHVHYFKISYKFYFFAFNKKFFFACYNYRITSLILSNIFFLFLLSLQVFSTQYPLDSITKTFIYTVDSI
jgi:hypothetical protein